MTIAALLVWMCTAAAGGYLLATRARSADAGPAAEPEPQPAPVPAAAEPGARSRVPRVPRRPVSRPGARRTASTPRRWSAPRASRCLACARSPSSPTRRWPITGFAFWAAYLLTGDRIFAAIGFGILLGAICAGVSWFTANKRAVRRGRADALVLSPRLLLLHGAGAALTLLLTALITARV